MTGYTWIVEVNPYISNSSLKSISRKGTYILNYEKIFEHWGKFIASLPVDEKIR